MHFKLICPAIVLSVATGFAACNLVESTANTNLPLPESKPSVAQKTYADGVRRVTIAELDELMKEEKVFVVDVRDLDSYNAGHIPGSKLIPEGEVKNRLDEFPRDKTIVTYCS